MKEELKPGEWVIKAWDHRAVTARALREVAPYVSERIRNNGGSRWKSVEMWGYLHDYADELDKINGSPD